MKMLGSLSHPSSSSEPPGIQTGDNAHRPLISACLIVRDEEARLGRCLKSLSGFCDEIIVVDTGSADRTVDIAREYGARVVSFSWTNDFAAARNHALQHASGDWVLVIDADEELVVDNPSAFRRALPSLPYDALMVPVHNLMDSGDTYVSLYERFFRRWPDVYFEGRIHEQVWPSLSRAGARFARAPFFIKHDGYLGSVRAEKRKSERNIRLLQDELDRDPGNWYLHLKLTEELLLAPDFRRATTHALRAVELCPADHPLAERCLVIAAQSFAAAGRPAEGVKLLQRHSARAGLSSQFQYALATLLQHSGEPRRALLHYLQAIGAGEPPEHAVIRLPGTGSYRAWTGAAHSYRLLGDAPKALAAVTEALRVNPRYPEAAALLAQVLAESQEPDEAVMAQLERADLSAPENVVAVIQGLLAGGRGHLVLQLQPERSPGSPEQSFWRGIAYVNAGDFRAALDMFSAVPPGSRVEKPAKYEEAFCRMVLGDLEGAHTVLRQTIAAGPGPAGDVLLSLISRLGGPPGGFMAATVAHRAALERLLYRLARANILEPYLRHWEEMAQELGLTEPRLSAFVGRVLVECGREEEGLRRLLAAAQARVDDPKVYSILERYARLAGFEEESHVLADVAASLSRRNGSLARAGR